MVGDLSKERSIVTSMAATSPRCILFTSMYLCACQMAPCMSLTTSSTLERLLEKNKDTPAIKAIYFPYELMRSKALLKGKRECLPHIEVAFTDSVFHADLEYYYGKDKLAQVIDPSTMTPAVKEYVNAMEQACEMEPALLVAHSYSRYLGDLSGGQILAKRLKKHVLGLSETDGEWDSDQGLAFYAFNNIGNQNAFKNEYRERLDTVLVTQKTRGTFNLWSWDNSVSPYAFFLCCRSDCERSHPII